MIIVGGRDVDHLDLGIGRQFGVRAVGPGKSVLGREGLGSVQSTGGHGDQGCVLGQQREVTGDHTRDMPGGEHSPTDAPRALNVHGSIKPHGVPNIRTGRTDMVTGTGDGSSRDRPRTVDRRRSWVASNVDRGFARLGIGWKTYCRLTATSST